eukprot:scaffold290962_cov15-Tisochrysis_lutea.AAC.1
MQGPAIRVTALQHQAILLLPAPCFSKRAFNNCLQLILIRFSVPASSVPAVSCNTPPEELSKSAFSPQPIQFKALLHQALLLLPALLLQMSCLLLS